MRFEPLSLRFEKILSRTLDRGQSEIEVIGTDSTLALGLFLTQLSLPELLDSPHLIVVPDKKGAENLESHVRFFDPAAEVSVLPAFDVSPYSGLYPSSRVTSARVRWAFEAQNPSPRQIFIATAEALSQRTLPIQVLKSNTLEYRLDEDLPDDLAKRLTELGYQSVPVVEDEGTFAIRGGIIDIFSPAHHRPVRIELFGDTIESLRFFNPDTQRSEETTDRFTVIPPREIVYDDESRIRASSRYKTNTAGRPVNETDRDSILHSIVQGQIFPGLDFLVGDFYDSFTRPTDHFNTKSLTVWQVNPIEISRELDLLMERLGQEHREAEEQPLRPAVADLYNVFEAGTLEQTRRTINLSKIQFQESPLEASDAENHITLSATELKIQGAASGNPVDSLNETLDKVRAWRASGFAVFVAGGTQAQSLRLMSFFEKSSLESVLVNDDDYDLHQWFHDQQTHPDLIHILPRSLTESQRLNDEQIIFLRDEDFFGKKQRRRDYKKSGSLVDRTHTLTFGDLNPGDAVVHEQHGIGIYEGLKVMPIGGVEAEFITLSYKDGDKLYLPIYRIGQIQKYSGPAGQRILDKLGGTQWQKTKSRVRNHLREIAADLLQLYAKRTQVQRPPFPASEEDFSKFEASFPYDETEDQLKAVSDILADMTSDKPMDRLVCGDVGFGKTEIAMRAAFKAVEGKKQVAVLAPTTVLSFQHVETFQRRFKNWPVSIRALNRFVSPADVKKTLEELREGKIDIVVGTHRLLSKDVVFKDLGLLIVDEEQRFGVTHKEKIKKLKTSVDTLTLSATPIPRTLNMSLVGMRDLSIINTPPIDRLPTRTFVTKFDKETIGKAIQAEIQRGGQVFFLHNRVQSIYALADELREIVPEARIRVGHGQMDEDALEKTMVAFFHHQVDVLVCTTIIESGIDNPRANTMFIDNAHQFGLSQLYQLRGRVGRSKERAYCYLLIPANRRIESEAQDRLKIIQENTALGSGIRIAHHDLELRGAGNLLGEDQSGQIDAVGYEMYLELLEEAIRTIKGEEVLDEIEPEINVRIPALIPESYIPDIRIRLSYYKALAGISSPEDVDRIEEELSDQFGKLPDPVLNLMGLMLIRHHCRELGIRDLSSGTKTISLAFTERTPLPPQNVVQLAQSESKKYSITPDMRLIVRMESLNWPNIYDELLRLEKLCPPKAEKAHVATNRTVFEQKILTRQ